MSFTREWYPDDYDWTNNQMDTHFTGAVGGNNWNWSGTPPKDPLELWDGLTEISATTQPGVSTITYELNKPTRFAGMKIGIGMSSSVVGVEFLVVGHINDEERIVFHREAITYEDEEWIPLTLEWEDTSLVEALELQLYVYAESGEAGIGARTQTAGPSALAKWKEVPVPVDPAKIFIEGPVMNSRLCFTDR